MPTQTPIASYLPTLVVNVNASAAHALAAQLRRQGFQTDVATDAAGAQSAVRAQHYGSLVMMADPALKADLGCLAALRRHTPRTWIIAIGPAGHLQSQTFLRCGADAVLAVPFSIEELAFRLSAFAHRSRPL